MGENRLIFLFCLMFIGVGAVVIGIGIQLCRRARASRSWPAVGGVVKKSKIVPGLTAKGHRVYQPVITYEYSVAGKSYSGTRINTVDGHGGEDAAKSVLNRYPVGTSVTVYYDAASPESAVLRRGMGGNALAVPLLGLLLMLFGLGFMWALCGS